MGHYGQSQTPGQGQDNGHYPTKSKVTAILRVIGGCSRVAAILGVIDEQSHRREYLFALLGLLGLLNLKDRESHKR